MITIAICTITFIIVLKLILKYRKTNGPPGPSGLPFIGVAHKIDPKGLYFSVDKWSEEYGDVFQFEIFGEQFVTLNGYHNIYDALVKRSNEFAGRASTYRMEVLLGENSDIIFGTFTPKWLAMKKLAMQTLKMYGSKLLVLQEISCEFIREMVEELNVVADSGEIIALKPTFHRFITAIITSLIYGRRMEDDTARAWLKYEADGDALLARTPTGLLLDLYPWTCFLPISNLYKDLIRCRKLARKIVQSEINKSKEKYIPGEVKCFIDGLFHHQACKEGKPAKDQLSDEDLYFIMYDMNIAGTATTSMTLTALIACLINKPDIQEKIAEEIREIIGERPPVLEDRPSLPYVEAAILEILRYHTLVPLNIPHQTTSDVKIGGYNIPKGTSIFFNLWKLHHDPAFWEEPWEFKPERFMENGTLVPIDHPSRKRLIAFGAGRRVCPGEVLARNRLFLMVTSLLQNFQFLPESEDKRPSHDPHTYIFGFDLFPKPYNARLSRRN